MARNFLNYVNFSYSGGMVDSEQPDRLAEDEAVLIQNAYINQRGSLTKRSGILLSGNDTGSTAIVGLKSWTENDGTKWVLRTTGTNLQYLNSTTWDNLDTGFTTGLDMDFAVANNKLYMVNGTDNTHSWDGASTVSNSALVDMGSTTVPTGKYIKWWKNYMFIAGASKFNGASYPSRVWFSNLGAPDTWTTATDYFDVNLSDGQAITGLAILQDYLVIFKERSIWVITGTNPSDWKISGSNNNLTNVNQGIGCKSYRSIVQVGDDLWFMANDGIRSLRRNAEATTPNIGIVSGDIQTTITGLNQGALSKVAAILFNKRVYFAMPNGSSSYNNIVMVADTRITKDKADNPHPWVKYTGWQVAVWEVHEPSSTPSLYFGEASADSLTFQAETGTNDNSAAIDFDYRSKMIDLREQDMRKTARFLWAHGEVSGDNDVSVYSSDDNSVYTLHGLFNLAGGDVWNSGTYGTSTWGYAAEKREKFVLNRAARQIQIRYRNNTADESVTMLPYTLAIKVKQVK